MQILTPFDAIFVTGSKPFSGYDMNDQTLRYRLGYWVASVGDRMRKIFVKACYVVVPIVIVYNIITANWSNIGQHLGVLTGYLYFAVYFFACDKKWFGDED